VRYTCDMTWDILLVFFWALMLAAVAGGLAVFDSALNFFNNVSQPGSSWGLASNYYSGYGSERIYLSSSPTQPSYSSMSNRASVKDDGTLSKAASMVVEQGRTVLVVAVALASVQLISFIITAALSSANRNALRAEAHAGVLPIVSAPKPVAAMVADGYGGGKQQWKAGHMADVGVHPGVDGHDIILANQHRTGY
jgi:hypothetical protein